MVEPRIIWHYGNLPKLTPRVMTEEEKEANSKRLSDFIESWKKFELEHPDIANNMWGSL